MNINIDDRDREIRIRFPSVTRLHYNPDKLQINQQNVIQTRKSFKSTFYKTTSHKNIGLQTLMQREERFKIIRLPEREDIMNICRMTVQKKSERLPQSLQSKADSNKKILSLHKNNKISINFLKNLKESELQDEKTKKLIFSIKRRQELMQKPVPPPLKFDYFEIYPQISQILSASFGVSVAQAPVIRMRRARIDLGNNGLMVRQVLKKRTWWNVIQSDEDQFDLIWTEQPKKIKKQTNQKILNPSKQLIEIKFSKNISKILNQLPKITQLLFTQDEKIPSNFSEWFLSLNPILPLTQLFAISNHLPGSHCLTNKKQLFSHMLTYYLSIESNPYDKIPRTYPLNCYNWQESLSKVLQKESEDTIWIIKPGEHSNRGRGIVVCMNVHQVRNYIMENSPKSQEKSLLLQQYITPFLYEGRKFDIRCYLLAVEVMGSLRWYWYEEGYIRTASEKFSLKKSSKSIHLTNDAIQKYMPNYSQHQPANKLSYAELDKYFLANIGVSFYEVSLKKMKKIAKDICVASHSLIGDGESVNFQIFGLDFLIDKSGMPWLCQVNSNPCLQTSCSLLSRVIPEMLQNTLRLVLDVLMPNKKRPDYAQHFLMNNKYSLLYFSRRTKQCQGKY